MTVKAFGFTRKRIRDLKAPTSGRITYKDKNTTDLQIRVNHENVKIFSYVGKLDGRTKRVTIGQFDEVSVFEAQNEAKRFKGVLRNNIDPLKAKRSSKHANITLSECLEDYLRVHNTLAVSTVKKYRGETQRLLKSWLNKPLKDISRTDIARKHRLISNNSPSTANRVMRLMRALFNFANQEYEDKNGNGLFPDNPVSRLSHQRLWNKIEPRTGSLKPHQLEAWLNATESLPEYTRFGEILKDYLQLILFTGLRLSEALSLEWQNIDFRGRTLLVTKTKNGKPHMLPLSDFVYELLQRRYSTRINEYVFPACYGEGHLSEPKTAVHKVRELSGIHFMIHDLRRTFITVAESLDISAYAVKRLVNHSMGNDVTAGYIVWDVERIREPMQKISTFITKAAGHKLNDNVIKLAAMQTKKA